MTDKAYRTIMFILIGLNVALCATNVPGMLNGHGISFFSGAFNLAGAGFIYYLYRRTMKNLKEYRS